MRFRVSILILALVLLPAFGWIFWSLSQPETLSESLESFGKLGDSIKESVTSLPTIAPVKAESGYTVQDEGQNAIKISYANQDEAQKLENSKTQKLSLSFPDDPSKQPLKVNLPGDKAFSFSSLEATTYTSSVVAGDPVRDGISNGASPMSNLEVQPLSEGKSLLERIFPKKDAKYLKYESEDGRKLLYYSYQSDGTTGEKTLKHWTIYRRGEGNEKETYSFEEALLKKNEDGSVSVYYTDPNALKNQEGAAGVEANLLERAQRVLAQDQAESGEPDATIPAPFVLDKDGEKHNLSWEVSQDKKTLSITFSLNPDSYPLALDPTLSFTAPAQSNTGDTITGEATNTSFGTAMTTGDFNNDGRTDLAIGANGYSSLTGRVYIFYSDGTINPLAIGADVIITGVTANDRLGQALMGADWNADGKTDLVIGASDASGVSGRAYIFWNGSIVTEAASGADVIITGTASNDRFGTSFAAGDFNADGKVDLVVGANQSAQIAYDGKVYIFYSGSIVTEAASGADITITGESNSYFGNTLTVGDLNSDGKNDLVVGAYAYSSNTGRGYIFYNDGSIPTTAATADVIIDGNGRFGWSMITGDFNVDGKTDLVVGSTNFNGFYNGRIYIFYNDGTYPATANTADLIISEDGGLNRGLASSLVAGDFNNDGRIDIAAGGWANSGTGIGQAYIFYNDGSYPATSSKADVYIAEATLGLFGTSAAAVDFNNDGKTDVAFGAMGDASYRGKVYIFYSQNGQVNTNQSITGNAAGDYFGYGTSTGDFNADGRTDLVIGAPYYSSSLGRAYIFYGDGQIPTAANSADVIIDGTVAGGRFGIASIGGDFNADGKTDLVIGANVASRAYIFYNDGSYPATAATADITITDSGSGFGIPFVLADLNNDGKQDLIGSRSSFAAVYVFYNDGSIPTTTATADITLMGTDQFGSSLATGDFNVDGNTDLAVGDFLQGATDTGAVYLFYNDGSIPTTAGTADVAITGAAYTDLGTSLAAGDFNADGRMDLASGAYNGSRAYIFYNDGSWPSLYSGADVEITGANYFGTSAVAGDFNADGRTDLAIGGALDTGNSGQVSIFYNDGTYPTNAAYADVTIAQSGGAEFFSRSGLTTGDMNGDGRVDLVVGAFGVSSYTGQVFIYETRENFAWQLEKVSGTAASGGLRVQPNVTGQELSISGEASSGFGNAMATGDFNADGKIDLAVGASAYASNTGRVYLFYNDGSLSSSATNADVVITGEATNAYFGGSMAAGDLNADGKMDLAVQSPGYNNATAHIFYNDGNYPRLAASADVVLSTLANSDPAKNALSVGDANADGQTDLIIRRWDFSSTCGPVTSYCGKISIYYNDGSYSIADVVIDGAASNYYLGHIGIVMIDMNADGKKDIVTSTGQADKKLRIFYNDGSYPADSSGADATITGLVSDNLMALAVGDMNADGREDLITSENNHDGSFQQKGRVYIFYNDGSLPATFAAADVIISSEGNFNLFGSTYVTGDFNADGRTDLAASAPGYSTNTGRAYIFYNDGSIPTTAATADVILTGETTSNYYGYSLAAFDANSDGKTDLAVGAYGNSSNRGKVYIYTLNDTVITGGTSGDKFGYAMTSGDFNADGKSDLAVGANYYSGQIGRVYIFYQDGIFPTVVASADVTITGEVADGGRFGSVLTTGDLNADGRIDLVVGAPNAISYSGRAYVFYNDGSIPTTGETADAIIRGESSTNFLGSALTTGDFNTDGKTDLVATAPGNSSDAGRAYIFYNGSIITEAASGADIIIHNNTAEHAFGGALATADFNTDGKADLVVSGTGNSFWSENDHVYIFYNDGSIPTTVSAADYTITGEATNDTFGAPFATGDLNADGKIDLVVGAVGYSSSRGRAYVFYNDGSLPTTAATADVILTGESAGDGFCGTGVTTGDVNADGRSDLLIGGYSATATASKLYTFYNDGSYPTTPSTADVIVTGDQWGGYGAAITTGDFNTDGKIDIAVGDYAYSSSTGRVYLIMSEAAVENVTNQKTLFRGGVKFRGGGKLR